MRQRSSITLVLALASSKACGYAALYSLAIIVVSASTETAYFDHIGDIE
jgi:hypothetical protein